MGHDGAGVASPADATRSAVDDNLALAATSAQRAHAAGLAIAQKKVSALRVHVDDTFEAGAIGSAA